MVERMDGRGSTRVKVGLIAFALVAVMVGMASALAPYLFAEVSPWLAPHAIVDPAPARLGRGAMVDDYFAVEPIAPGVWAIGEPRYYQQNYAYLIVGRERALLFDAGTGTRNIRPVVAKLTSLPLTVMVSHLHFDHLGGVANFASDRVAMIDLPATRADVHDGRFRPGRYQYSGFVDGLAPPTFRVDDWLAPGSTIDLGGRRLTVLSTPGHTPTSAALYDADGRRLFIGDYIYPTTLYAFLPSASLSAYQATARRLLATLPADTVLWTAHCCRSAGGVAAPWLNMTDLRALDAALTAVRTGRPRGKGFYPRVFPVNEQMTLATGLPWNNR